MSPHLRTAFPALAAALVLSEAGCAPSDERADERAAAATESATPVLKPFEGLAREEDPPPARNDSDRPFAASIGLEENVVWKRALSNAKRAEEFYAAAQEAHRQGDRETLNDQGREARILFDRALEETAEFEAEIVAEFGEGDPAVERIVDARSGWFDCTRWLHKSIGR